jgi:hypothetical protein
MVLGVKRPVIEADHLPLSTVDVNNDGAIPPLPIRLHGVMLNQLITGATLPSHSFIHQWLYGPLLGRGRFSNFVILYRVGRPPWTGDQPVTRPLPTHTTAQTQNKCTQTSMPRAGFVHTNPVFERARYKPEGCGFDSR